MNHMFLEALDQCSVITIKEDASNSDSIPNEEDVIIKT